MAPKPARAENPLEASGVRRPRGRAQVEKSLVDAAADLLAEVGPKQLSMRAVSTQAGVNIAQAYHYFGSKEALLTAAMRALAQEWYAEVAPGVGSVAHPSPVPLGRFSRYWRALAHVMLDEDYRLAEVELREDISVARTVLARVTADLGRELDLQERITLAAAFSLSLGWITFEHFMFKLIDLPDDPQTRATAREHIEDINRELVGRLARRRGTN